MPCWQVQSNTIAMDKMTGERLELFKKALQAIGYQVHSKEVSRLRYGTELAADNFTNLSSIKVDAAGVVTFVRSAQTVGTDEQIRNELKRAYSAQVVEAATKKFGWQITKREGVKLTAERRF